MEYSICWATIIYSDDVKKELIKMTQKQMIKCAISPIHDKDVDHYDELSGDPVYKKPHYHAMCLFKSKKSRNQINILFNHIGSVGAEHIYNIEQYYYYLWHDQETDKAIYNPDDCIFILCSESDFVNETTILNNILDIVVSNNICSVHKLFEELKLSYIELNGTVLKVIRQNMSILRPLINENESFRQYKNKKEKEEEK